MGRVACGVEPYGSARKRGVQGGCADGGSHRRRTAVVRRDESTSKDVC